MSSSLACCLIWVIVCGPAFAQAPKQVQADEMMWIAIRDQKGAGVYELYLSMYPNSPHAKEAKRRLAAIAATAGETWRGFRSLKRAPLPKRIDKRALGRSVFLIQTFGSGVVKPEIVDVSNIKGNPLKGKRLGMPKFDRALQLASCIDQKIRNCPVLDVVSGTAFAIDNVSTMATARHVMGNWAQEAVKANPGLKFADIVQPFVLFNAQGQLIYNSVTARQRPKLQFWNAHPIPERHVDLVESPENHLYNQSDYLEFSFDKPVFQGSLKRSTLDIETAASSIYAIGYPDLENFYRINHKEEGKAGKLPNYSLTVSGGRYQGRFHRVYLTNAYSFNGMSGGPVIDATGSVLGVFTSLRDARFSERGVFERTFFLSADKKLLRETWDLPYWRDMLARRTVEQKADTP